MCDTNMEIINLVLFYLLVSYFIKLIRRILDNISSRKTSNDHNDIKPNNITTYSQRSLMTPNELSFYNKLKELEIHFNIVPQVNLASIINKHSNDRYRTELFRNVDFGIFTKDYTKLLLLIELNDSSHKNISRRDRDLKVKKILNDAGIPLINFYSNYPNEKEYVINRILKTIEE